ncbi:MAG: glutathione S-transferase family protein [Pseudomonadota bacterium]|nr:glutathione S-transferase family protein [Pseudomonadota bacterium]
MHTLHYAPGAASLAVHWLLIELGIPHELRPVNLSAGEQKRPEYLALNPAGVVPTLVIDGEPLAEVGALLMTLADEHATAGLAPPPGDPQRAAYYQWIVHLANAVQPLFRLWWYPHEAAGESNADVVQAHVAPRIEAAWERIDAHLGSSGPYLLGERLSAADFHLAMLMRWSRNMPRPAHEWPHLGELARRMKARPSFHALYEREGLSDWM